MNKRDEIIRILPVFLFIFLAAGYWHLSHPAPPCESAVPAGFPKQKILLVPLDSRPPCRQMVVNAGRICRRDVWTPPQEILDYYSLPGSTGEIRQWLQENMDGSEAVIISIDQLLYGGLLSAREKNASPAEIASLLGFLRELHQAHPRIPIYAFSILPRMTPQDSIDGYQERKDLIAYSRLAGKKAAGEEIDETELSVLKNSIPPASLEKYLQRFRENERLNRELIDLAAEGVFARLVLGQDDGEVYSIPNIEKNALQGYMKTRGITDEQVFLTHGADEIALTCLTEIAVRPGSFTPSVYLDYNTALTRRHYLPYMAVNLEDCAREKAALLGIRLADSPEEADFILFISANDAEEDTLHSRADSTKRLKAYLAQDKPVALVDLSEHFLAEETLLPRLISAKFPLNSLAAYAGWNTASNSLGTALSEAVLYLAALSGCQTRNEAVSLAYAQTAFLQGRLLEDYFYLKAGIDTVNLNLRKYGYQNTADLDLEHNYRYANAMLQKGLAEHLAAYEATASARAPFTIGTPAGSFTLRMQQLGLEAGYPWPRTFEAYLEAAPLLQLCL